jgi:GT2 family glycosyltransferase
MRLTAASWLSDNTLLLVGSHDRGVAPFTSVLLVCGDTTAELGFSYSTYPSSKSPEAESPVRWVAIAHGLGLVRGGSNFGLNLSSTGRTWRFDATSVALALIDLRTLIRNEFTALEARERTSIVEFISSSGLDADDEPTNRMRLSRSLNIARDMLRERLPICELRPNRIEGLSVEAMMALDDVSFYVEGWMCDGESTAVRLTAVSPEGTRTELLAHAFRYRRPDVEEFFKGAIGEQHGARYGFICYFRASARSLLPAGWVVEVETAAGIAMEVIAPSVITDDRRIRAELLNDFPIDVGPEKELRRLHISPALTTLQLRRNRDIYIDIAAEMGEQPINPQVSILVPLYGRIDLLEHQMAQFADDPELHASELIYVLDSPELKSDLLTVAEGLFRLYRLPFKILVLSENAGFSTANNIAASRARGRLLLLLNSDVLPTEAGWLSKLTDFYHALDKPGALGPKLIYEDNSLQHAGLYFEHVPGSDVWMNEHYYKGLHSDLPAANIARPVPAVTGACLMIDAKLYATAGGLSGMYIQGDYEDSDLCLRLSQSGHENWYFPGVVLYHLEAQSYPTTARQTNTEYNRWLFNEIWGEAVRDANVKGRLTTGSPHAGVIANGASKDQIKSHARVSKTSTVGGGTDQIEYK